MKLNRTTYLWTLFALGVLGYLIQIRGQNIPLWIILLAIAGMTAFFAILIHVVNREQAKKQNAKPTTTGSSDNSNTAPARKPRPTVIDKVYVKQMGKPRSKK